MWSIPNRRSEPSQASRTCSGRPSMLPPPLPSVPPTKPNFVATLTWSRRSRIALPTSSSFLNGP